jgi:hypothetical protein
MKCPKCAQDLVDEQDCQSCQRQAPAATTPGDLNEQGAEQTSSPSSPPPTPGDALPRTAGSNPQTPGTPAPAGENTSELGPAVNGPSASVNNDGMVVAGRDVNFVAILKSALDRADESHKIEKEKSLYEFVKKLPRRTVRQYQPPPEELARVVAAWRDRRLILISSAYVEYALDAAWEVIERLPGSPARFNGIIAFEDIASKNIEFSIQKLFDQLPEAKAESVVIVNATHTQAQTFPNSFLGNTALAGTREDVLRDSKHFLVVLVDLSYAHENHLAHQSFPYWEIPFLEPFLKGVFPQEHERLLKEIRSQRGKWEQDEVSFAKQVINYQNSERLLEVIESGGPQDPEGCAEALLKAANPVEKTVLYAATVFEEITSPEFCRVIEALLNERARRATEQSSPAVVGNGSDGSAHAGETEIPLRRLWEKEKDDIFTKWLVEGATSTDSPRTVSLSESNLREPLRKQFEKRHRFYLMDQFNALQETGILFYPSLRVAENTTQIAMDMARIYPDEFDESWIVSLVMRLRRHFTGALPDESDEDDQMFKFLPSAQPGASDVAFARISDICKGFLGSPSQSKVVPDSLDYLLQTGCHEEVLWLIKQLKFSSEFDDWHWLKQLLFRGDAKTKYLTYHYIISYLKRMGTNVYDGLTKIETWLPSSERQSYSEFDTFVFRLMIKYCFDTIARFDHRHYGQWPSRYPLFAIKDAQLAESHTALLAHWLFHPAVDPTLADLGIGGSRITLVGALLAEWSFILLGTADLSQADSSSAQSETDVTTESAESENSAVNWSATDLFNLLLREFITQIDLSQRVELLSYWTQLEHELFRFRVLPSHGSELRNELTWKRKLVRRLITEIKKTPPPKKSWPMKATPATATPADQA